MAKLKGLYSLPLIERHTFLKPKVKNEDEDKKTKVPLHITGITWLDWILEVLICIVAGLLGIITSIFTLILMLIANEKLASEKNRIHNNEAKTFKSVFIRAFLKSSYICHIVISLAVILLLLSLLYLEYASWGWGVILIFLAAVLVVALLTLLFKNSIMPLLFLGWGKDK